MDELCVANNKRWQYAMNCVVAKVGGDGKGVVLIKIGVI